jgi:hypothetical protein
MTYLTWGCEPLAEECQSCLDAICNACSEEFKKKRVRPEDALIGNEGDADEYEPDCDRCELEKKPSCRSCEIILGTCRKCSEHVTCEFTITR